MLLLSTWRSEVFIIINWLLVINPQFRGVDAKNTCWEKEFQVFQLTINYQYNSNSIQKIICRQDNKWSWAILASLPIKKTTFKDQSFKNPNMHLPGLKYMTSSMVDSPPWNFFVPPFRHVPTTSFSENAPNPMLTSYKLWKSICLRNDLLLGKLK